LIIAVKRKELVKYRIKAGYGLRAFARKIGMSSAYLSQLESGDRNPSPETAKKIVEAIGVGFDDLFLIVSESSASEEKPKEKEAIYNDK